MLLAGDSRSLRGKLVKTPAGSPALQTEEGRLVPLSGDEETKSVLNDERLQNMEFEVIGKFDGETFVIDPIHTAAVFVLQSGHRKRVTYWCDVCAIRTYTPGLCQCCREETALDLREPDKVDTK
jgi:hypothetical protein